MFQACSLSVLPLKKIFYIIWTNCSLLVYNLSDGLTAMFLTLLDFVAAILPCSLIWWVHTVIITDRNEKNNTWVVINLDYCLKCERKPLIVEALAGWCSSCPLKHSIASYFRHAFILLTSFEHWSLLTHRVKVTGVWKPPIPLGSWQTVRDVHYYCVRLCVCSGRPVLCCNAVPYCSRLFSSPKLTLPVCLLCS